MTSIWSCGGGTQSAAIGALIVRGILPVPDLALIVDTERECSTTWAYMDSVLDPALRGVGCRINRIRKSEYTKLDLWGESDGDTLLIGGYAYGGKAPMYCSGEWKRDVARRWIRAQGVKQCELWMGISVDEMRFESRLNVPGRARPEYYRGLFRGSKTEHTFGGRVTDVDPGLVLQFRCKPRPQAATVTAKTEERAVGRRFAQRRQNSRRRP